MKKNISGAILTQTNSIEASSQFTTELLGNIIWAYDEEKTQIGDLYETAKKKAWNASNIVDWNEKVLKQQYPVDKDACPFQGFAAFDALTFEEQLAVGWWAHGLEVSEILHGEQGALIIASQLVSCMPTVEAKLFASSQVADEARHVEFFCRYLKDVVGEIYDPSAELMSLIQSMISDPRWYMKFISCQIIIESLAMAKFQELKQKTRVPLLSFAIDYVLKDEARHVKFGANALEDHLATMTGADIQACSDYCLSAVLKLANAQNIYDRIARHYGWNQAAWRLHLRRYRIKNPDINRNRFRQLSINLSSVGLMTEITRQKMQDAALI